MASGRKFEACMLVAHSVPEQVADVGAMANKTVAALMVESRAEISATESETGRGVGLAMTALAKMAVKKIFDNMLYVVGISFGMDDMDGMFGLVWSMRVEGFFK